MTQFEDTVHETIKNRCVTYWLDGKNDKLSESNTYYFNSYEDNLFGLSCEAKKAYQKGLGKELQGKMSAIHSSSAMTANIFGCGDEKDYIKVKKDCYRGKKLILPEGRYHVEYEVQLPALSSRSPANLDVCLMPEPESSNSDTVLLFEMKMTEWILGKPSEISASYLNEKLGNGIAELIRNNKNHFQMPEGKNACEVIQPLIRNYIKKPSKYVCSTERFDVFQIVKHIYSIHNIIHNENTNQKYNAIKKKLKEAKKIRLIIGYWTMPENSLNDSPMSEEYKSREERMQEELRNFKNGKELQRIIKLFKEQEEDFDVECLTVKEIVDCLEISDGKRKKMQRYVDM